MYISTEDILEALNNEGGITVELKANRVIQPSLHKGYWVGIGTIDLIHVVALAMNKYMIKHILGLANKKGIKYLGFWLDDKWLYVDKVVHYTNKEKAIQLAKAYKQKAIYSIHEKKDIYVN